MQSFFRKLFANKTIDPEKGCWIYTGHTREDGYAHVAGKGVHVWAVMELGDCNNKDPDDFQNPHVHHKCFNPPCFNPEHLECMEAEDHRDLHAGFKQESRQ